MFEVVFVVLVILYALFSVKVDSWITISALGFISETPMLFVERPKLYSFVRSVLFLAAAATCIGMVLIPWYVGIIALAVVWLVSGLIGRNKAFANYRQILREMAENEEAAEERSKYEAASQKTNKELMDIVRMSMKYGI